jgi:hypothetical protein
MDEDDNRFFVVKVPVITEEDLIPELMRKLEKEIPAFLYFLKTRQLIHPQKSRLWFDPKVYETEALTKIRINTRSIIEKELLRWFTDIFAFSMVGNEIHVTPIRLAQELEKSLRQIQGLASHLARILKEDWKLPQSKNSKFDFPVVTDEYDDALKMKVSKISFTRTTGTFYYVTREFIDSKTTI